MRIEDIIKNLHTILKNKNKSEIEALNDENLYDFIDKIIKQNNSEIELEIFNFSNGKIHNILEYYEEYKNQELKPMSGKHYQLLLENNLLIKLKIKI